MDLRKVMLTASIFLINWLAKLSSESAAGRGQVGKRLKLKAKPNVTLVIVTDPGLG